MHFVLCLFLRFTLAVPEESSNFHPNLTACARAQHYGELCKTATVSKSLCTMLIINSMHSDWQLILIKGIVHPKMKFLSLITHPRVVPNPYDLWTSLEHILRYVWWNSRAVWALWVSKSLVQRWAELCGSLYMTCSLWNQECSSCWAVHTHTTSKLL